MSAPQNHPNQVALNHIESLLNATQSVISDLRSIEVFMVGVRNTQNAQGVATVAPGVVDLLETTTDRMGASLTVLNDYYTAQYARYTAKPGQAELSAVAQVALKQAKPPEQPVRTPVVQQTATKPLTRRERRDAEKQVSLSELQRQQPPQQAQPVSSRATEMAVDTTFMSPHDKLNSPQHSPLKRQFVEYAMHRDSMFDEFPKEVKDIGLLDISEWVYLPEAIYINPERPNMVDAIIIRLAGVCVLWYPNADVIRFFIADMNTDPDQEDGFRHEWHHAMKVSTTQLSSIIALIEERIADTVPQ